MIVVIDYEAGNVASVLNMIKKAGGKGIVSSRQEDVRNASKLILPGVGAFDHGMRNLAEKGLVDPIKEKASSGTPLMGICLGMGLLARSSEEGKLSGLGLIQADFRKFRFAETQPLPVPHVGWNTIEVRKTNPLVSDDGDEKRFYFVHSYHAVCDDPDDELLACEYGYSFPAAYSRGNVFGFQFHPEKSHRFGLDLITRFLEL